MKKDKAEAKKEIEEFFSKIEQKKPKQIEKIKKLAMHNSIKLNEKRKKFCKKCYSSNLKVLSVKKGIKRVKCKNCEQIIRWKIK